MLILTEIVANITKNVRSVAMNFLINVPNAIMNVSATVISVQSATNGLMMNANVLSATTILNMIGASNYLSVLRGAFLIHMNQTTWKNRPLDTPRELGVIPHPEFNLRKSRLRRLKKSLA